jgi:hypothetical protein
MKRVGDCFVRSSSICGFDMSIDFKAKLAATAVSVGFVALVVVTIINPIFVALIFGFLILILVTMLIWYTVYRSLKDGKHDR